MKEFRCTTVCILLIFMGIAIACTPTDQVQVPTGTRPPPTTTPTIQVATKVSPTETPIPSKTSTSIPESPTPSQTLTPALEPADIIFYHGKILTMEESQPLAEAIAIRKGIIQAVGTDEEISAYQGEKTQVIDLQKNTLMPGFIDGHTHILTFHDRMGKSLSEAQETALRFGLTSMSEMWANNDTLNALMEAADHNVLRIRVNVFPSYNDGILDENRQRVLMETWFPEHSPILDPESFLRIPGIKVFVDGDNADPSRGCWALSEPFEPGAPILSRGVCGTPSGDLYWSQEELNQVVANAQQAGYRVAFHAMGDRAIETALNAIEYVLDGQPNASVRHQIEHNSLARDDLLVRYETLDISASVRGYGGAWCDLGSLKRPFGEDRYLWYVNRYVLPNLPIHTYIESDYGWHVGPDDRFAIRTLDPLVHLYGIVTHNSIMPDGSICEPDPLSASYLTSVERALEMLTIEPAYAVSMEDYVGSLRTGKYADLIILSANPLEMDPLDLKGLQVWMTMVAGEVEYCASGREVLCPGAQAPVDLATSGNLALKQQVTASSSQQFPAKLAVDGDESTSWGAGDFAPQWIEVDLGAPAKVTEIRMRVAQSPKGETLHRILTGRKSDALKEIHRFQQVTKDGEWLVLRLPDPMEDIQIVRVETISSPSWVAWFEIEVEGYR